MTYLKIRLCVDDTGCAPLDSLYYAYDDDRYDGAPDGHTTMGTGCTRLAAIADLLEKLDSAEIASLCKVAA